MDNTSNTNTNQSAPANFIFHHPNHAWKPDFDQKAEQTSMDAIQRSNNANEARAANPSPVNEFRVDWDALALKFQQNVSTAENPSSGAYRQEQRQQAFQSFRAPLTSAIVSQEERRKRALDRQKTGRQDAMNRRRRNFSTEHQEDDGESDSDEDDNGRETDDSTSVEEAEQFHQSSKRGRSSDDEMDGMEDDQKLQRIDQPAKVGKKKGKRRKFKKHQGYGVMYGESLDEMPHDLLDKWVMMPYPVGKRCIVTTGKGETVARRKNGSVWKRFQSTLPNGSKGRSDRGGAGHCILDCVYDAVHWTFYVLDVMCWKGYSVYNCDTDFRHFWLQTKVESEMDARTGENMFYKFKPLRPMPTTELGAVARGPERSMREQGYDFALDGMLLYHRETGYIEKSTPLVCWVPLKDLPDLELIKQ
ncbi:hypothetical protein BJV82DRAFT_96340 [Fennellomyces sp. T-0311]|nr:hypothetical protein BJV82DRAFT_96340 [Fennellomyces sp. T-0311]